METTDNTATVPRGLRPSDVVILGGFLLWALVVRGWEAIWGTR